jgi:CTP:molybdopterin cytidylyltransferase MocA
VSRCDVSVVCVVGDDCRDLGGVHVEFRQALAATGRAVEFVYVLDGPRPEAQAALARNADRVLPVRVVHMAKGFGHATGLEVGFAKAEGRYVLTIPDRPQIDPTVVGEILRLLDGGAQLVATRREPRRDALPNRLQSRVFHGLVRRLAGHDFQDLTCELRGMTQDVARRLHLYGDQHRFIPILAARAGFAVMEIPGTQHPDNRQLRLRWPGVYGRRLLDILNIYFLTRFTRKPLRFFGLIGAAVGLPGLAICLFLAGQRLWVDTPIRERPLLLLGVLLIVIGVQLVSLGLLGEIIIFMSGRRDEPETVETELDSETNSRKMSVG